MKNRLKFENLTLAQKGQRILINKGINTRIIRVSDKGCAHAIIIPAGTMHDAERILAEYGMKFEITEG